MTGKEDQGRRNFLLNCMESRGEAGCLRVAAYIRVSTDSSDQENSYAVQERYFAGLLEGHSGWISAGIYSDYGISGTGKQRRSGYRRMLRHCNEGRIDRIVCKSISRFARNTSDFMEALEVLRQNHVTVLFEKEGLDTADSASEFILTTLAAVAQEEARAISASVSWSVRKRFPGGQARNYVIYGYRYARGKWESFEDGYRVRQIEIVENEAEIVRRIFQAAAEGMSYIGIARMLNREQVPPPDEKKPVPKLRGRGRIREGWEGGWTGAMISRILSLERYCGDVLLQKTHVPDFLTHKSKKNCGELPQYLVKDHHPPIIDRELFGRVQVVREYNVARYGHKGERHPSIFSGRLVCGECGRNFYSSGADCRCVWFCPTRRRNNGKHICGTGRISEVQIGKALRRAATDHFALLGRGEKFVSQIRRRLENAQRMDRMERDRSFLKKRLHELRSRELSFGKYDEKEKNERLEMIVQERAELEKSLEYMEQYWTELEEDYDEREKALAWMETLAEGREGTAAFLDGLQRRYMRAFVLSVTVYSPFYYMVHWYDDIRTDVKLNKDGDTDE